MTFPVGGSSTSWIGETVRARVSLLIGGVAAITPALSDWWSLTRHDPSDTADATKAMSEITAYTGLAHRLRSGQTPLGERGSGPR